MHPRVRLTFSIACFAIVCASALDATHAADIFWSITPGTSDTEVITEGDQVFGYYFNPDVNRPATVTVNTVPFTHRTTADAPPGLNFNGSYNNPENVDLYQVPLNGGNSGLDQILDGQNWGAEAPLTLTGLVPDGPYLVQFMISDDRSGFLNSRNYDNSNANDPEGSRDIERAYHSTRGGGVPLTAPLGSVEGKIFTGLFIADASGTQDIRNWLYENANHLLPDSGSQINAIQLRTIVVPEPASITLAVIAFGLYGLHRHWTRARKRE
jgi:hypothetical protein